MSEQTAVLISVVIPTFNRRHSLSRLLDSLSKQTLSQQLFEVVVASDGSTDGTENISQELSGGLANLRLLKLEKRGPGAARNAAARLVRGRYIAFTDDDCLASPDWLEQILRAFERTGAAVVQGRTTTDRPALSPLTHQIEVLTSWPTVVPTCNAAYRKDVFDAVQGFDEEFRFAHGEDTDLVWRAEEFGHVTFANEVHIIHPPRRDRFSKLARWVQALESEFFLYYKNPAKYQRYVSPSPWWTIYWNVFVVGQLRRLRSSCKYLIRPFRPSHFLIGCCLVIARWYNLVRCLPLYLKAWSRYRSEFAKSIA